MASLEALETSLTKAVSESKTPHAVVAATNASGSFTYNTAAGKLNFPDPASPQITTDAVFLLASSTKLLATIAVLQGIDKGLYTLDTDISTVLPELGRQKILKGFDDDDKPILEERKGPLTLRHLLTHSSGVAYDGGDPLLIKYVKEVLGREPGATAELPVMLDYPLRFEPGTAWSYGASIDWAGKFLERVADTTLEDWMEQHMWAPLGVKEITFWAESKGMKHRVPTLVQRTKEGGLEKFNAPWDFINAGSKDCFGGKGAYGSMTDYIKVQQSILANDGKLLKPETVEQMFQPQLSEASKKALNHFVKDSPMARLFIGEFRADVPLDWGIGGVLFMDHDLSVGEGGEKRVRRKKGTLSWGGMANTFWTIDREAGVALTFGTQVMPPGDWRVKEVISEVEYAVYKAAGVQA